MQKLITSKAFSSDFLNFLTVVKDELESLLSGRAGRDSSIIPGSSYGLQVFQLFMLTARQIGSEHHFQVVDITLLEIEPSSFLRRSKHHILGHCLIDELTDNFHLYFARATCAILLSKALHSYHRFT